MSKALQVPKSQAIALFVSMGFATAKKWNCKKLTEKINAIDAAPDEPLETEELDELMDNLMQVEEAVVVEEEGEDEEVGDDNEGEEVTDDEEEATDNDEDMDDEDEEEVMSNKDKKGKKAKEGKKDKKKAVKKEKKESLDAATLALLKTKPMRIESLVKALLRVFPEHDEETLTRTTKRRVSGHLQSKYDVEITKSKKGAYSIEE